MKTSTWIPMLAVTALLAAACGSASPRTAANPSPSELGATANPTNDPSPSPSAIATNHPTTPKATSTPPATNPCPAVQAASISTNRSLALVWLRGSNCVIVRDVTDISHATTVGAFPQLSQPQFVNATTLSYVDGNSLFTVPPSGSPKTLVVTTSEGIVAYAWSPDGRTVVYLAQAGSEMTLHQRSTGTDRVLGSIHAGGVGGCETIEGCAIANSMDFLLAYSPNGSFISLVFTIFAVSAFRIWSSDGKLLKSSDSQGTTMSAWSGSSLYFRDSKGVEVWRDGTVSSFLPGVAWIKPKASTDGRHIVYVARDSAGWAHTYVVESATRTVRELKSARTGPFLLTANYIWYQGERACGPNDTCGPRPPFHPLSGKTYIYDLVAGSEAESIITAIADVWPHAA